MTPITKTIIDDLIAEFNELTPEGRNNQIRIQQYKREAEILRDKDPARGFSALGIVATLQKNYNDMNSYHQAAIKYEPMNSFYKKNYAVSLTKLGYLPEAYKVAKEAYEINKSSPELLFFLLSASINNGRFCETLALCDNWQKLKPDEEYPYKTHIEKFVKIMEKSGINDEELVDVFNIASSGLRKKNVYIDDRAFYYTDDTFGIKYQIDILFLMDY